MPRDVRDDSPDDSRHDPPRNVPGDSRHDPPRNVPDDSRRDLPRSVPNDSRQQSPRNPSPGATGFTRRDLLKTGGVGAAGIALQSVAGARGVDGPLVVSGAIDIVLRVNGAEQTVHVEPRTTLAEALRLRLDLTGTKIVCDRGSCSACTVHLDGIPVCSCMTLAIDVGARELTTIEGLAQDGDLHPVQECFIEYDAMQCGYCTPGMVMSCAALLARNPRPTEDDVKQATSGNLCRCGTYPHVFKATLAAAQRGAPGAPR